MIEKSEEKHFISEKIIGTVKNALALLCECQKERHVQDILAAQLNCKSRKTVSSPDFPDVEVDLIGENFTIEVKYNGNSYSGISQILAQRLLYDVQNTYLLHIHEYLDMPFINAFTKLVEELDITGILIDKRRRKMKVIQ